MKSLKHKVNYFRAYKKTPNVFSLHLSGISDHGILGTLQILRSISRIPQWKIYRVFTRTSQNLVCNGLKLHMTCAEILVPKFKNHCIQTKLSHFENQWKVKDKPLESKYPNASGLNATFHKNNHVLPIIRIYLVNYKKSC